MPATGCTVVVADIAPERAEAAGGRGAQLQGDPGGRRRPAEEELLVARQLKPHRASHQPGEVGHQWLQQLYLAPKAPTHRHRDHPDAIATHLQGPGDRIPHRAHPLGGCPDRHRPIALHGRCDDVGFQEAVVDPRQRELVLDPDRRRRQALLEITTPELELGADVAGGPGRGLCLRAGGAVQ